MKQVTVLFAAFLATIMFFSCSKSKDDVPVSYQAEGIYSGKIGTGSTVPGGQFELHLKEGGQLDRVNGNGAITGVGTWQLEGNNFTAHYQSTANSTEVDLTGTLNREEEKIIGNWINNGGTTGTYYVTRK